MRSDLTLSPGAGVLHDELTDKFVETEGEEQESSEDVHPESGGDAFLEDLG